MSDIQSYQRLDQQGEDMEAENTKRTSWCGVPDEQQLREDLIQRATARLKRRMLEDDLSKIMEQIVVLQSHLETLHKDATTTIDTVTNMSYDSDMEENKQVIRELQLLEKRLKAHKTDLEQLQSFSNNSPVAVSSQDMIKTDSKVSTQSSSMSRLSSDSIFGRALSISSKATSVSSQSDSRSSSHLTNEQRRDRRRRRIQYQHQKYQEMMAKATSMDEDYFSLLNSSEDDSQNGWVPKYCNEDDAPFYDLAGKRSFKQGSFCGSVYCDTEQQFAPIPVPEQGHHIDTRSRRRQRKRRHHQQQQLELEQNQPEQEYTHYFHPQQLHHQQEYHHEHQHFYHHSQELEQDYMSDNEGSVVSNATFSSISTLSNLLPEIRHPLSLNTPVLQCSHDDYFGPTANDTNDMQYYKNAMQAWFSDSDSIAEEAEEAEETQSIARIRKSIESHTYPERNVLDEAMSFLDGISENGDDGGFGEDMYLLLHNPDLCCRPLSEIQSTMHELKQKQQFSIISLLVTLFWPGTYIQLFISAAYSTACTSLEWCRFLSVLAAAVVISLIHGPKDLQSVR